MSAQLHTECPHCGAPLCLYIDDSCGPPSEVAAECSHCGAIPRWRLDSWIEYRLGTRETDDQSPQRAVPPPAPVPDEEYVAVWTGRETTIHRRARTPAGPVYAHTRCHISTDLLNSHWASERERAGYPHCAACFAPPPAAEDEDGL